MPGPTAAQIADLVETTLKDLGRGQIIQIAQSQTDYEVYGKWFAKDRVMYDSGYGIQQTLMNKLPGAARHVKMYAVDEVAVSNLLTNMSIPWRHLTTNWSYEVREMLMNKGKARINKLIKPRRHGAMIDAIELIETAAWSCPSSTNTDDPYGVPYWIVKNASAGFNGGAPSGHTTIAGVNPTTVPTFKNYTGTYSLIGKTDVIPSLRTAYRKTAFKSPVGKEDFHGPKGKRYRLYVNEATISDMEEVGESQNENLGRDLAPFDGTMTFRKNPIIYVPELDSDTTNPIYGLDHWSFFPVVLSGDYFRESGPTQSPKQHNVFETHYDLTYNFVCMDRRRNFVFYKV
jgi:hypothetical protein